MKLWAPKKCHYTGIQRQIYQSIEDLHASCPDHLGDWYFTGDYPTAGGIKVVCKAFMNYIEGSNKRAY